MSSKSACARADSRRRAAGHAPLVLLGAALAAACGPAAPPEKRVIPVFGTIVQAEVAGADAATARRALDALEALYRELDVEWRSFGPGELGRVNDRLAAGEPADLSPRLRQLVERGLAVREASGGLFDPRVGPLVELWGFADMAHRDPPPPPGDDAVAGARAEAIGAAVLHLEGARLSSDAPVRLDLAGVAKGSALEAGAALLRSEGVTSALIVAGGDVIAIGTRAERPWRVGVRDPRSAGVLGTVALEPGEAALSSGDYERGYEQGGTRYHHIIDPRTGRPAVGTAGTTVLSRDPALGNAAATALMVAGPEGFRELAARLGIDCALLVASDGRLLETPCMARRLERR